MKPQRVLALVHKGLEPPDEKVDKTTAQTAEWRMEYDVVRTLKVLGHELRVIGVHDDLTPIRTTMDEFKPTITFNLMEAFDDVVVFDQNVVSYLELLKVPYTGCNPRGLTLSRDKGLAKKLMAYHRIPVPDFLVVPLGAKVKLPKRLHYPLIVKSLTYESSTGISQASVVANDEQSRDGDGRRNDHEALRPPGFEHAGAENGGTEECEIEEEAQHGKEGIPAQVFLHGDAHGLAGI